MADLDKSLINIRYNQVLQRLESFGGGSPAWTPITPSHANPTQGLVHISYTTAQRNAIVNPTPGLVIYNTTTNKLNVYTTTWEQVTSA
jgi:hypothetical protein